MKIIGAALQLIRWKNLLIMAAIFMVVRYGFLQPLGFEVALVWHWHVLFIVATLLIAAGGNIVNDVNDIAADKINKPNRVIVGATISKDSANFYGQLLLGLGTLLGLAVGFFNSIIVFSYIFAIAAILLLAYAKNLKKKPFIGNLTIAFLSALLVFNTAIFDVLPTLKHGDFEYQIQAVYVIAVLAGFSFLTTLAREVIKDLQDEEGDRRVGYKTLPIVAGKALPKIIAIGCLMLVSTGIGWLVYKTIIISDYLSASYLLLTILLPAIFCIAKLGPANTTSAFKRLSLLIKLIMVTGVFSLVLFTLSVKLLTA